MEYECKCLPFFSISAIAYSLDFEKNVAKIVEKNLEKEKEQELGIINQEPEEEPNDT